MNKLRVHKLQTLINDIKSTLIFKFYKCKYTNVSYTDVAYIFIRTSAFSIEMFEISLHVIGHFLLLIQFSHLNRGDKSS